MYIKGELVHVSRQAPKSTLHLPPSSSPVDFNETTQVSEVICMLIKLYRTRARFL